jgi:hypothetical protein
MADHLVARRTVITSAALGLGAGFASGGGPAHAQSSAAQAAPVEIWSQEYWAHKGDVKLNLWRKRIGAPKPGEQPRPVLFLVHGSSLSARSSYDLNVPGNANYSMMNEFAGYGYDVWTMDHDGYGYSGSSGNNSDIASGVEDLRRRCRSSCKGPASRRCTCLANPRAPSAPARSRRASRIGSNGSSLPPSRIRETGPPKSNAARSASQSCAPIRAASATPP